MTSLISEISWKGAMIGTFPAADLSLRLHTESDDNNTEEYILTPEEQIELLIKF